MKISIGCDHGALALKNKVLAHLQAQGHEVKDFGTYTAASCDYPEFAAAAARAVASGECEKGIVLCTTGIGVSISARISGSTEAHISVRITPGATQFTRTPLGPSSFASALVRAMTAPLVAE